MSDTVDLDFYFDPACGWAWRTPLWIREVAARRPVTITWKLVSLGVINAPADLFDAAQSDPATETQMIDLTRAAMSELQLFGVPTLALKDSKIAVFGPVIHPVPTGDEALELWDVTYVSLSRPYLFELKRTRDKYDAPQFADAHGLSVAAPVPA